MNLRKHDTISLNGTTLKVVSNYGDKLHCKNPATGKFFTVATADVTPTPAALSKLTVRK